MELSIWQELLAATLGERVLIFDLYGKLVHGHPRALEASALGGGRELAQVYPEAWPLFKEVLLAGRVKRGLRLEGEGSAIRVDAYPMNDPDQPQGVLCLLHLSADRPVEGLTDRLGDGFRAMVDSSYDGLWICDAEANVIQINKASERLHGVRAKDMIGQNMRDLVAQGVVDRSITLEVLETGGSITRVQTTHQGRRLLSTGNPVFDPDGRIAMVVTNDRDLSELDRLRDEILEKTEVSRRYQEELIDRQKESLVQENIIFRSRAMERVVAAAIRVAKVDTSVLITGPSGAGKEMIADLIHKSSPRADSSMVRLNCGSIPETLFESELFGYAPGSFTGARKEGKPGLVEVAHGGTLFLDEVGEMALPAQVKLLRFLDSGQVQRVGSTKTRSVDVRVLAATNRDLEEMVRRKEFREDLYYRLRVIPLHIPPLAERPDDIAALAEHFVRLYSERHNLSRTLTPRAVDCLLGYDYPGNVRELANLCERLVVMSAGPRISVRELPAKILGQAGSSPGGYPETNLTIDPEPTEGSYKERMAAFERTLIERAVSQTRTQQEAAALLGLNQSTVARKMRSLGLSF